MHREGNRKCLEWGLYLVVHQWLTPNCSSRAPGQNQSWSDLRCSQRLPVGLSQCYPLPNFAWYFTHPVSSSFSPLKNTSYKLLHMNFCVRVCFWGTHSKTSPRLSNLNMYPLSWSWHLAILPTSKWWFFRTADPTSNCHLLSSSLLWLTLFSASNNAVSFPFCLYLQSSHLCFSLRLNKIFTLMLILA